LSYTKEQQEAILFLKQTGLSSRVIANELGISKSGVNYFLVRDTTAVIKSKEPRVLILDLETAAAVALTFGRFKINLGQENIVEEGGWVMCASYRWLGEEKIHSIQLTKEEALACDDSRIIATFWDLYEEADAIVAHNAQQFDHKVLQARVAANHFPPLPTVKVLDTLVLAKKHLRLPSNKLDSIGEYFNLGRKIDNGGISLWKRVQSGCQVAMKEMVDYCIQDTELLTQVYLRLRAFGHAGSDFNAGLYYNDDKLRCRRCGSEHVHPTGRTSNTSMSVFTEFRCDDCGAVQRDRVSTTTKEKRSGLLM
jgi:transposase-like protein